MNRGFRRIAAAAVGIAIATTSLITTAGVAGAQDTSCPENSLCLWQLPHYGGAREVIPESGLPSIGECFDVGLDGGVPAESVKNNTEHFFAAYETPNCIPVGNIQPVQPGGNIPKIFMSSRAYSFWIYA